MHTDPIHADRTPATPPAMDDIHGLLNQGGAATAALQWIEHPVLVVDPALEGPLWANTAAERMWGCERQAIPWRQLQPTQQSQKSRPNGRCRIAAQENKGGRSATTEVEVVVHGQTMAWQGRNVWLLVLQSAPAITDLVTGLPTRQVLDQQLATLAARGDAGSWALAFLDLDNFKAVNDNHGHLAGDHALNQIAGRLRASRREEDLLVRWAGDEFVLLAPWRGGRAPAVQWARRIAESLDCPLAIPGCRIPFRAQASIGIALSTGAVDPRALLHAADGAMYQAKAKGGGGFAIVTVPQARRTAQPKPR